MSNSYCIKKIPFIVDEDEEFVFDIFLKGMKLIHEKFIDECKKMEDTPKENRISVASKGFFILDSETETLVPNSKTFVSEVRSKFPKKSKKEEVNQNIEAVMFIPYRSRFYACNEALRHWRDYCNGILKSPYLGEAPYPGIILSGPDTVVTESTTITLQRFGRFSCESKSKVPAFYNYALIEKRGNGVYEISFFIKERYLNMIFSGEPETIMGFSRAFRNKDDVLKFRHYLEKRGINVDTSETHVEDDVIERISNAEIEALVLASNKISVNEDKFYILEDLEAKLNSVYKSLEFLESKDPDKIRRVMTPKTVLKLQKRQLEKLRNQVYRS